jgi:hypothetical protein
MAAGHPMYAQLWSEAERNVRERAAFEIGCAPDQLQIIPLAINDYGPDRQEVASQIGVTGCGHRLVYVITAASGWVLNSSDAVPK